MSKLEKDIVEAQAKLDRLMEKKRIAEEKERAIFGASFVETLDEIDTLVGMSADDFVALVRANVPRTKRRRAAARAAAKRAENAAESSSTSPLEDGETEVDSVESDKHAHAEEPQEGPQWGSEEGDDQAQQFGTYGAY